MGGGSRTRQPRALCLAGPRATHALSPCGVGVWHTGLSGGTTLHSGPWVREGFFFGEYGVVLFACFSFSYVVSFFATYAGY